MKKTLIALMALAGVAMAESLSLETKVQTQNEAYAAFTNWSTIKSDGAIVEKVFEKTGNQAITFYVAPSDLFGGDSLVAGQMYQLDTFSWVGNDNGYFTGGNRTITFSVGDSAPVVVSMSGTSGATPSVTLGDDEVFTFAANDIIKVTIAPGEGENVCIKYFDVPAVNKVLGISTALKGDGTLNYFHNGGDHNKNGIQTGLKYDTPIIKLTAHAVPEPATATLSLLALAGLCARRRRA